MAFLLEDVLSAANFETSLKGQNAANLLTEHYRQVTASQNSYKTYDDFLCHSHADKQLVLGVKKLLEQAGRSVFVDWIVSPNPPGTKVTASNANSVRNAMQKCRRLVYLHTKNSSVSKWCPWELGYFDALGKSGNRIALVAITRSATAGQEYLDLYPQLDRSNLHA
ncbi:MAG: toll/interleukin-1 receptor domain-containing protein [Erythrobacter sp.]